MRLAWMSFAFLAVAALPAAALAADCPSAGDSNSPTVRAADRLRNRQTTPADADIDPSASLYALTLPGGDLGRWSSSRAARVTGYVIDVVPGGLVSANCHAVRSTILELGRHQGDPPNQRLFAVVTPYWRDAMAHGEDYSTLGLRHKLIRHWVRVTGWLFDDWEDRADAENTNPGNADNVRATIWEIHPVTDIEVLN